MVSLMASIRSSYTPEKKEKEENQQNYHDDCLIHFNFSPADTYDTQKLNNF